jgi:endonuclease/exonuclease/phosphatase family metal-dependent hydrolase
LIGLQEVWRGALSLLDVAGLRLPNVRGADSGLGLVTPHPVEGLSFTPFAAERGVDRWKSKGMLEATVELPAQTVHVLVTHLQAGAGAKNARVRADQVGQLLGHLTGDAFPVIVLGDMNLHSADPIDQISAARLEQAGLVDAARSIGREAPTYVGSTERYDRVHVKAGAGAELIPTNAVVIAYDEDPGTANPPVLSDHLPLRVTLDVR